MYTLLSKLDRIENLLSQPSYRAANGQKPAAAAAAPFYANDWRAVLTDIDMSGPMQYGANISYKVFMLRPDQQEAVKVFYRFDGYSTENFEQDNPDELIYKTTGEPRKFTRKGKCIFDERNPSTLELNAYIPGTCIEYQGHRWNPPLDIVHIPTFLAELKKMRQLLQTMNKIERAMSAKCDMCHLP